MPRDNARDHTTRLGIESLEDRTVLSWFGTSGGVSIAVGNLFPGVGSNNEVAEGTGPGTVAKVTIFNTNSNPINQIVQVLYPFGTTYKGGVFVATGDLTGDGQDDLIVSTAGGKTGTVMVYEFTNGGPQLIETLTPFGPNYSGGVDVAAGDVAGDLTDKIIVGQSNSGSTVEVYAYDDSDGTPQFDQIRSFQAFGPQYTGGVTLTAASIDTQADPMGGPYNHAYDSIIVGKSRNMPEISIWNAQQPTVTLRSSYMAFDTSVAANRTGVNVAAGDTEGQRGAEIYVTLRGIPTVRIIDGETGAILGTIPTYPTAYTKMVNMAVGGVSLDTPADDPFTATFNLHDMVVVAATGDGLLPAQKLYLQAPVDFPGKAGKAAGLNGSKLV